MQVAGKLYFLTMWGLNGVEAGALETVEQFHILYALMNFPGFWKGCIQL